MTFPKRRLSRLARIKLGKMLQSEPLSPADIEADYVRAAHVQPDGRLVDLRDDQHMWFRTGELSDHNLREGDVLIVEGGAGYGRSAVLHRDLPGWGFQNSIIRARPIADRADSRFLDYSLQSSLADGSIPLICSTATIPHFTAEKAAAFPIPAPSLEDQRAIADFLDRETAKIDALIDKQTQMIGLLRERREAAVDERLRPHALVPLKRVIDPARPLTYGILQAGPPVDGGVPYIGPSDIPGEGTAPRRTDLRTTSREIADAYSRSRLSPGDVVASIGPAYGHVMIVSEELAGANLTQDTARIACRQTVADPGFVVWALGARTSWDFWDQQIAGATFRRLNLGTLGQTPIPLPDLVEQRRIAGELAGRTRKLDALIAKAEQFVALATERRAALITAAVTGEIDIREGALA